jgi:hypothetical protein
MGFNSYQTSIIYMDTQLNTREVDVVIVGAGVASLYLAYRLRSRHPKLRVLILEKSARIGGRMLTHKFRGVTLPMGAGIGRAGKDKKLLKLMRELGVPSRQHPQAVHYDATLAPHAHELPKMLALLRAQLPGKKTQVTFAEYGRTVLGEQGYALFTRLVGYTDFEQADAYDTVKYYGFEDTYADAKNSWQAVYLDWGQLTQKLVEAVGPKNIVLKEKVVSVSQHGSWVVRSTNHKITCKRVFIGVTKCDWHGISVPFKTVSVKPMTDPLIGANSFVRVYGQFDDDSAQIFSKVMRGYTVVNSPLQKVIPIAPDRGVHMIAYADNAQADIVAPHARARDFAYFERELERVFKLGPRSLKLIGLDYKVWKCGTHYNKPANNYKSVSKLPTCIYRIGEAVSKKNQGWVEGALESVEDAIKESEM